MDASHRHLWVSGGEHASRRRGIEIAVVDAAPEDGADCSEVARIPDGDAALAERVDGASDDLAVLHRQSRLAACRVVDGIRHSAQSGDHTAISHRDVRPGCNANEPKDSILDDLRPG